MSATMTRQTTFANRTLADIAASLPGATSVFRSHKLDFCCGGHVSLTDATIAKGLSLSALETELEGIVALGLPASRPEATNDLITLIETRYHTTHRREFPELIKLARRVEAVHKTHPAVPHGLANLLQQMSDELGEHMTKRSMCYSP